MLQSKTSPHFRETPIERFITVSEDILDLSKDPKSALHDAYNEPLLQQPVEKVGKNPGRHELTGVVDSMIWRWGRSRRRDSRRPMWVTDSGVFRRARDIPSSSG